MKKYFLLTFLSVFSFIDLHAVGIYKYVSDSGHEFYYVKSNDIYDDELTDDEYDFIAGQSVCVLIITNLANYNEDKIVSEARSAFKDSIRVLYNENKEYMWKHFPEYRYTFDEVYDIVRRLTMTFILKGVYGDECSASVTLDIRNIGIPGNMNKRLSQYPYISGYLYKSVKYVDGKRCKITSIPRARIAKNSK